MWDSKHSYKEPTAQVCRVLATIALDLYNVQLLRPVVSVVGYFARNVERDQSNKEWATPCKECKAKDCW